MKTEILSNLRNILANLYPDEPSTRRIIADSTLDSSRILLNSTAINNWHSILVEAEKVGRIDALLDVIVREYGDNWKFRGACDAYRLSLYQNRLKNYLSMAGHFNSIRKLLYQYPQLLPIEKYMFYQYQRRTNVRVSKGGLVNCIAVRPDTLGIRGYLYYFGSPYENPFDEQGNPSIKTNNLLDTILHHAILMCHPLDRDHMLHPCMVTGDDSAGMKDSYYKMREIHGMGPYGSIDIYLIVGQRIHQAPNQSLSLALALAKLYEKFSALNKSQNLGIGNNTRIEILSYTRMLTDNGI